MKKTILVVDDFTSIRHFICEMLERKGYRTLGAANGNEAFRMLQENACEVNLVITDYNMPDCSGYELLKKIRTHEEIAKVPVIFLTTELSPEKIKLAKDAGLYAWIKKPYRAEVFFSHIESALLLT